MVNKRLTSSPVLDSVPSAFSPRFNRKRLVLGRFPCSTIRIEVYKADVPNVLVFVDSEHDYVAFNSLADAVSYLSNNYDVQL